MPRDPLTPETWLAHLRGVLLEADKSFATTGNAMEALSWVAFAVGHGLPVPPKIGAWLAAGLTDYRAAKSSRRKTSLDKVLRLTSRGYDAGRALAQRGAIERANAAVFILHSLGATVPDAATIVASVSGPKGLKESTISDRFSHSGLGSEARASRRAMCAHFRPADLEKTLAQYPDGDPAVEQAKASIRKAYAKPRL